MRLTVVAFLSALVACGGDSSDTAGADTAAADTSSNADSSSTADTSSGAADGAALYASHCAACHGADGSGGSGPNLSREVPTMTDAQLETIIQNGRGRMPSIAVPEADLPVLIDYLRTTFG